jgi:hypothetical protein
VEYGYSEVKKINELLPALITAKPGRLMINLSKADLFAREQAPHRRSMRG